MKTVKLFYIKQRSNPQFDKPYYVAHGQLSKAAAKRKEDTLYGSNVMLPFETREQYNAKIESLEKAGFNVQYS